VDGKGLEQRQQPAKSPGTIGLVVNGQSCGEFIGASPYAADLIFVGSERSLIVRHASVDLAPGEVSVRGRVVGWGAARIRR
jgi:hypothetical protein